MVAIRKKASSKKEAGERKRASDKKGGRDKKGGVVGREEDYALREGRRAASWMGLVRQRPPTSGSVPSVEEAGPTAGSSMTLELSL